MKARRWRGRRRRHEIYLVPGFFGFTNLGELKYFGHLRDVLARCCAAHDMDAEIQVVKTYPTASLPRRAARLAETLAARRARGNSLVHLVGHSSGGLDARLMMAPGASLPTPVALEPLASRVRSIVTISTPHYGTPIASFFAGLRGPQLLRTLSLSTMYMLRFGAVPVAVALQLGGVLARLDNLTVNSALVDELFARLLADFSIGRRRAVSRLLDQVATDQALLLQLTREGTELLNAASGARPGVRCGSVVTRAQPPGVGSTLAAGLDPSAQASHAIYSALYQLAASSPRSAGIPAPTPAQARVLRKSYGRRLPGPRDNDGVVPTRSQIWGEVIDAVDADHLDVIGHFRDPAHDPPHYDWLTSGSGFTRTAFEGVWMQVVGFMAVAEK